MIPRGSYSWKVFLITKTFDILMNKIQKFNPTDLRIIPLGDKDRLTNNAAVVAALFPSQRVMMIRDNDDQEIKTIRDSIFKRRDNNIKTLRITNNLKDSDILFYEKDVYSIDFYLLDPEAIAKVLGKMSEIEYIKSIIEHELGKARPKDILSLVWDRMLMGSYDEITNGIEIAKNVSAEYLKEKGFDKIVETILKDRE